MKAVGNALALVGAFVALSAAYLWYGAATVPAAYTMDSIRDDLIAIDNANMQAALVTAVSALLVAVGEAFCTIAAWRAR
jgi:hypothetical protein